MKFQVFKNHCILKVYEGNEVQVTIPSFYEALPVSVIGSKAFLSCKSVHELTLPDTITEVGDWAFAHMKHLNCLTLPFGDISFGKHVFLDCGELREIHIANDTSKNPGTPFLLASAVTLLQEMSLCTPCVVGDYNTHNCWLQDYDAALLSFLAAPDDTGFEPVFLGWFSVEDFDSQRSRFTLERQKAKTFLAFQRLLYSHELKEETKKFLADYLTSHMVGGRLEQEHIVPFTELCQVYQNDVRYLKVIADTGYITKETFPVLQGGLRDSNAEVMAFLLDYQQKFLNNGDFFDTLTL